MALALAQAVMFTGGPFFCYPLKPQLNAIFGDSYATAYRHFRRDHHGAANVLCHVVCLAFQVLSNFALLFLFDDFVPPSFRLSHMISIPYTDVHTVPLLAALSWLVALLPSQAPPICRLFSIVSLACAYGLAPAVAMLGTDLELYIMMAFVLALVVTDGKRALGFHGVQMGKSGGAVIAVAAFATWRLFWHLMSHFEGMWADRWELVATVLALSLAAVAATVKNPLYPVVFGGAFGCRFAHIATGKGFLFFWGCAFTASLFQGISHAVTGERATLINLQDEASSSAKVRFEWAHVTFFPDLLYHSVHQSLTGKKFSA